MRLVRATGVKDMLRAFWLAISFFAAFGLFPAPSHAHRVALIIGNDDYRAAPGIVPVLQNAANDARLIGQAARDIGFTNVRVVVNATNAQLLREFEDFYERASGAEVGFIYFAGHGFGLPDREKERLANRPPLTARQKETNRILNIQEPDASDSPEKGYMGFITGTDWDGRSASGLAVAEPLFALQRASRLVLVVDACRTPPVPAPNGDDIVLMRTGRIPRSLHWQRPMDIPNLFFAASTSNGMTTPDGPPGGHTHFALTFARLMREHRADQPGFGERLRDMVSARESAQEFPFHVTNIAGSGNPLRIDDTPVRNPYASPVLDSTLMVAKARDAAITAEGRLLVLSDRGVTDGAGRAVYRSGAQGEAIAISPDGSRILAARHDPLQIGVGNRRWTTPRTKIDGERVRAAHVTDRGDYVVATDANRLIGHNQMFQGYFPVYPAEKTLRVVTTSAVGSHVFFGTSNGLFCFGDPMALGYSSTGSMLGQCRASGARIEVIAESPSGDRVLTIPSSGRVQLRTAQYAYVYAELPAAPNARAISADWSRDGRWAVAGFQDGAVALWNAHAAAIVARLPSSAGAAIRTRFSPDGSKVVVVRASGEVQVWKFSAT